MKARLQSFLLAEGVSLDQLTGRCTAFNMMDGIVVAALPTFFARLCAVAAYELGDDAGTFNERVRLLDPQGGEVARSETKLDLPVRRAGDGHTQHRSIHMLWGVALSTDGDHRCVVEHREDADWVEVGSMMLAVVVRQHPVSNAAPSRPAPADPEPKT